MNLPDHLRARAGLPTRKAKGRIRVPGSMNKTEQRYAEILEARRLAGEILWWRFEAIALRLAEHKCFLHPDFLVMLADGTLEVHEVKGAYTARMDDGGIVKLKVAAATFPFVFRKCTLANGSWTIEEVA